MVAEWIVDVISFQKIFGLCGLKCHIVEIWRDVTFEDDGQRKCEYSARIREAGFAINDENEDLSIQRCNECIALKSMIQ